jgi:hypothetical protein
MKNLILLLFLFLVADCSDAADTPKLSYADFLKQVKVERDKLKSRPTADAREYFFTLIHEKVPAYWNGTPWDFNGVTRTPGQGQIACGYFITNTLADFGFGIERVKLAQAASSELIKATSVNIFRTGDFQKLKSYLAAQPDHSVFIVGLDFHTGYVTTSKGKAYFIHSNYINRAGVMKEEIDQSTALKSSKTFMIGNVSANDVLMEKWIR